jgi:hypothetical protein
VIRCDSVEMRKNLQIAKMLGRSGIDFVAVPVRSAEHKRELLNEGQTVLEKLFWGVENDE